MTDNDGSVGAQAGREDRHRRRCGAAARTALGHLLQAAHLCLHHLDHRAGDGLAGERGADRGEAHRARGDRRTDRARHRFERRARQQRAAGGVRGQARTKGVVLRINSPGGSPVQAQTIYDEMRRLRKKYPNIPLYAVVEDLCASGGYYVAVGADRIFVSKSSIVGSIGVRMDGFGVTGLMAKLGVERRLLTAGENKAMLDPFLPLDERHKQHAQALMNEIHAQFIAVVREGRGDRLKETPEMFSGLIWTGQKGDRTGARRRGRLARLRRPRSGQGRRDRRLHAAGKLRRAVGQAFRRERGARVRGGCAARSARAALNRARLRRSRAGRPRRATRSRRSAAGRSVQSDLRFRCAQ